MQTQLALWLLGGKPTSRAWPDNRNSPSCGRGEAKKHNDTPQGNTRQTFHEYAGNGQSQTLPQASKKENRQLIQSSLSKFREATQFFDDQDILKTKLEETIRIGCLPRFKGSLRRFRGRSSVNYLNIEPSAIDP